MEDVDKILLEEIRQLRQDVKEIREEMSTLKVKVASFSTVFGILGAYIKAKFFQN